MSVVYSTSSTWKGFSAVRRLVILFVNFRLDTVILTYTSLLFEVAILIVPWSTAASTMNRSRALETH